jgi:hypothetical protein
MPQLERRPGRKVTRQIEQPRGLNLAQRSPGKLAEALADTHNDAVRDYGSDSGGKHAFDPASASSAGVWDHPPFPDGAVVSLLSWGRIDAEYAQRLLEGDGVDTEQRDD